MTRLPIPFAALLAVIPLGALAALAQQPPEKTPTPKEVIPLVKGYKKWACGNPHPKFVASHLAMLCRMVTPQEKAEEKSNPHLNKYVRVYVKGKKGEKEFLTRKKPKFPVGTVIVKEKLADPKATTPELMTVMVKREKGYDSDAGDWEYLVVSGDGTKIQRQGKLENCRSCHLKVKEYGYVFRDYIPYDILQKMK
jgi:hypothetical protein